MWDNLIVYHANKSRDLEEIPSFYSWKTCQRCLFIGDLRLLKKHNVPDGIETFKGYDAYAFILEVITGLKSSLFAETEVLHQFKTHFEKNNLPEAPFGEYLQKLRNDLLEDAKFIRRNYLINLGDQSYGGITHRLLPDQEKVLILGSGQLAQKIIPFLKKKNREVILAARNNERRIHLSKMYNIESLSLKELSNTRFSNLVIAAPIDISDLNFRIDSKAVIVDLRGEGKTKLLKGYQNYHSFANILKTLDQTRDRHIILYKKLQHVIRDLVNERKMARIEFVNGWEDIPCLAG